MYSVDFRIQMYSEKRDLTEKVLKLERNDRSLSLLVATAKWKNAKKLATFIFLIRFSSKLQVRSPINYTHVFPWVFR